jgi:hypothetical protein
MAGKLPSTKPSSWLNDTLDGQLVEQPAEPARELTPAPPISDGWPRRP